MGGFAGFTQGLMGTIGPALERKRKERDEKNAELRKHYLSIAMTPNVPEEALADAAKQLKKLGYDDKESQNVFQKVHGLFGKLKQGGQQQAQQTGPIQPPGAPKQDIAAEGAMGPQAAAENTPSQRGPVGPPQVGGQAGSLVSGLQSAAKAKRANSETDAQDKYTAQKELLDSRLENQLNIAKDRAANQKELEGIKAQHATAIKQLEADYRKAIAEMQTGSRERIADKGNETKKSVAGMRPLTGAFAQAQVLRDAWKTFNDMGASPEDRSAARQIIEKNQQSMKTVAGTVDPLTGEKGPSYQVPSKQPLQSGANPATPQPQRQPAANQPRQPAQTQRIPTVSDSGEKMYQNSPSTGQKFSTPQPFRAKTISNTSLSNYGLMPVQFAQGETTVLPTSQKGAALLNDMAESTKLILRDIESGTKPGAAIKNASSKAMGRGPGYAKALLSYLNNQGFLEVINTPTTAARGLADQSRNMLPHVDEIENKIRELDKKGKLGPSMGRFNNFLTKKWGSADPEYAELQSLLGFFTTGMMRAHVGARGGVQIMDTFKEKWDSGKMDAPTLIAGLEGARSFLNTYAKSDKIENPGGANRVQPPSTKPPLSSFERN